MSGAQRSSQPWSMAWVVVAIVCTIVPYTFLRLHYSKPGRAYEPYHDMKDRATTLRLLSAGFQRIPLEADVPADPARSSGATAPLVSAPAGLPHDLAESLIDPPQLPVDISAIAAAPTANVLFRYPIGLTCTLPDNHQQLGGAFLYVRDDRMIVVPAFEKLDGDLLTRNRETSVRLTIPAGALKPGRYRVTLPGRQSSKSWTLDVK